MSGRGTLLRVDAEARLRRRAGACPKPPIPPPRCCPGKTETWGSKDSDTHSAMLRCVKCGTEWAVDESVLLEAADDGPEPPAGGAPADEAAGYVAVWEVDRQRT